MNFKISLVAAIAAIASCSMSLPVTDTQARGLIDRAMSFIQARTYNQDAMDAFSRLAAPPSTEYPIAPNQNAPNF